MGNGVGGGTGYGTTGTTGYGTGGTGTTGYGTGATGVGPTRRRAWGRHRNAGGAVAENKMVGGPQTKIVDMRAASGRRMAVAGAVISEKFQRMGADIRLGFYTISHPIHPIRRAAAKERAMNIKAAATERKRQKIARASDNEMRKRAQVREGRAARLNTAL
jgi:hypothetical protein